MASRVTHWYGVAATERSPSHRSPPGKDKFSDLILNSGPVNKLSGIDQLRIAPEILRHKKGVLIMEHNPIGHESPPSFWRSRYAIGLFVIGAIAAYFLLTEHLAHVVGALPLLLLLACPLMHVFMHHGHGGHGHHHGESSSQDAARKPDQSDSGEAS